MQLSGQQEAAVPRFVSWHQRFCAGDRSVPPGFVVMGEAGTGKTTLARALIRAAGLTDDEVVGGAMQASAAANLANIAGWDCRTLYRWNYKVDARVGGPTLFRHDPDSPVRRRKLLVVDEISQVNVALWNDTIAHGVPVLVLGDPGQLPPVEGDPIAKYLQPDVVLTEIHRQEAQNPIVYWGRMVRQGWDIPEGEYRHPDTGEVMLRKLKLPALTPDDYLAADAILVGRNSTRMMVNAEQRRRLGFTGLLPQVGEQIVCRRNQTEHGLINSFSGTVLEAGRDKSPHAYRMTFKLRETDMVVPDRVCRKETLGLPVPSKLPEFLARDMSDIAYGYAHTVHSFIGRQADRVLLIDEHRHSDRPRWLYTALTRAAKEITIASV